MVGSGFLRELPDSPWVTYKMIRRVLPSLFLKITDIGFEVADLTDDLQIKFPM